MPPNVQALSPYAYQMALSLPLAYSRAAGSNAREPFKASSSLFCSPPGIRFVQPDAGRNEEEIPSAKGAFIGRIAITTEQSELDVCVRHLQLQNSFVARDDVDFERFARPIHVHQSYPFVHNKFS